MPFYEVSGAFKTLNFLALGFSLWECIENLIGFIKFGPSSFSFKIEQGIADLRGERTG